MICHDVYGSLSSPRLLLLALYETSPLAACFCTLNLSCFPNSFFLSLSFSPPHTQVLPPSFHCHFAPPPPPLPWVMMDCTKHSAMIILTLMKDEDSCLQHLCWINIALTNRALLVHPHFSGFIIFFFKCCRYADLVSQSCHQHQTRYLFLVRCKICITNRRSEKNPIKWSSLAFSLGDQQTGARHYSHAAAFHATRKCVIDVLENKVRKKKK